MKILFTAVLLFFSGLFVSHTSPVKVAVKPAITPTPTINCQQVNAQVRNTGHKYTVDEYIACAVTPSPTGVTVDEYLSATPTQAPIYTYPTDTPTSEPVYYAPTPTPTPAGLQGQVNCNSNYAGGYNCSDYHGNQATLNPNYAGGYQGQDSHGNQI